MEQERARVSEKLGKLQQNGRGNARQGFGGCTLVHDLRQAAGTAWLTSDEARELSALATDGSGTLAPNARLVAIHPPFTGMHQLVLRWRLRWVFGSAAGGQVEPTKETASEGHFSPRVPTRWRATRVGQDSARICDERSPVANDERCHRCSQRRTPLHVASFWRKTSGAVFSACVVGYALSSLSGASRLSDAHVLFTSASSVLCHGTSSRRPAWPRHRSVCLWATAQVAKSCEKSCFVMR